MVKLDPKLVIMTSEFNLSHSLGIIINISNKHNLEWNNSMQNIILYLIISSALLILISGVFAQLSSVLAQDTTTTNNSNVPKLKDASLKVEKILTGLNLPTNIAFIDNKDFIILEKNGTVKMAVDGNVIDKPLLKVNVSNGFFQGMLGIAIAHSNKNINATATSSREPLSVFLFYTEDKGNGNTPIGNRLYRHESSK